MHYVYMIRSKRYPRQTYIGYTTNISTRIPAHNEGKSPHTSKFKPWGLVTYLVFNDKYKALEFETDLKSHSGKAFAKKRLW